MTFLPFAVCPRPTLMQIPVFLIPAIGFHGKISEIWLRTFDTAGLVRITGVSCLSLSPEIWPLLRIPLLPGSALVS